MKNLGCFITLAALLICLCSLGQSEKDVSERRCLDISRHKPSPSEEKDLHPVCSQWRGKVCCTKETTEKISTNVTDFYQLNKHLCKKNGLSKSCIEFFQKDACLFECSPDLWKYGNVKDGKGDERVKSVPLCESDCKSWFNACAKDMTCNSDWSSSSHKTSKTAECSNCESFQKKFGSAEFFCQSVWDHAYRVVKDDEMCLSFQGQSSMSEPAATVPDSVSPPTSDETIEKKNETRDEGAKLPETGENPAGSDSNAGFREGGNFSMWPHFAFCFMLVFYAFL